MIKVILLIMVLSAATAALFSLVIKHPRRRRDGQSSCRADCFYCAFYHCPLSFAAISFYYTVISAIEPLSAWVLLCTGIVYLLASIYAVGYMRMLGEQDRLPRFYMLFATFALTMLSGAADEQYRPLLDRDRIDDPGQHVSHRLRT